MLATKLIVKCQLCIVLVKENIPEGQVLPFGPQCVTSDFVSPQPNHQYMSPSSNCSVVLAAGICPLWWQVLG